jgi:hypothetical protein
LNSDADQTPLMLTSAAGSVSSTWTRIVYPAAGSFFEILTFLIKSVMSHLVPPSVRSVQRSSADER